MHPREYLPNNYMVPEFLKSGIAMWTQAPRSIGNDLRLEHETALLEVAAGIQFLRDMEFEKVILVGMSGGASLFSFYLQQANLPPEQRIARTPAGKPTKLQQAEFATRRCGICFATPGTGNPADELPRPVWWTRKILWRQTSPESVQSRQWFRKPPESSTQKSS